MHAVNLEVHQKFIQSIETNLAVSFEIIAGSSTTAVQLHLECYRTLRHYIRQLKSNRTCLTCMMRTPEKVLTCGHAICENCLKVYGTKESTNSFRIKICPLCGSTCDQAFRVIPPTAGIRLLSIDGGGVRGIVSVIFLRHLEYKLQKLGCPLTEYFDLVCGTSAG